MLHSIQLALAILPQFGLAADSLPAAPKCLTRVQLCVGNEIGYFDYKIQFPGAVILKKGTVTALTDNAPSGTDIAQLKLEDGSQPKIPLEPQSSNFVPWSTPLWLRTKSPVGGMHVNDALSLPYRSLSPGTAVSFFRAFPFREDSPLDFVEATLTEGSDKLVIVPFFEIGTEVAEDSSHRLLAGSVVMSDRCFQYRNYDDAKVVGFWETRNPWRNFAAELLVRLRFAGGQESNCFGLDTYRKIYDGPNESGTREGATVNYDMGGLTDGSDESLYLPTTTVTGVYDNNYIRVKTPPEGLADIDDQYAELLAAPRFGFAPGDKVRDTVDQVDGEILAMLQLNRHAGTYSDSPFEHFGLARIGLADGTSRYVFTEILRKIGASMPAIPPASRLMCHAYAQKAPRPGAEHGNPPVSWSSRRPVRGF